MRWTRSAAKGRSGGLRTAKSCGPDIPTLISGATHEALSPTETTSPVSGASTKETVKTTAQGKPDCFGEPVVINSCAFCFAHEAAGAHVHPAFPAPSVFGGTDLGIARAQSAPRDCPVTSLRGARDKIAKQFCAGATKQS